MGLLLVSASFSSYSFAADPVTFSNAPKLSFRYDAGIMKNVGTIGGAGAFTWGLDILALYYPDPIFALGAGYRTFFDLSKSTTPVSGGFLLGRWYFYGQGTRSRTDANRMEVKHHENYAFYTGMELGQSNYYLGESAKRVTDKLTGSYFNMNALAGTDVRLNDHFEINVEASLGLLIFAATDSNFRLQGTLMSAGISYLW